LENGWPTKTPDAKHRANLFSKASETSQYTLQIQRPKIEAKTGTNYANMEDTSPHNSLFPIKEIQEALKTSVGSSPGPDDIN
jgi:hypothetical protein